MNLITAFEEAATKDGAALGDAFPALSESSGVRVDHGLFSRWRRGARTPPPAALQYMAKVAAPHILKSAGVDTVFLDEADIERIALSFCPPLRQV